MPKVLLTYGHQDVPMILTVTKILQEKHHTTTLLKYVEGDEKLVLPIEEITSKVKKSDFILLFMTDKIVLSDYIRKWVLAQVKIASEFKKKLFIFESTNLPIPYGVPYVTDYFLFNETKMKDLDEVGRIMENLGIMKIALSSAVDGIIGAGIHPILGFTGILIGLYADLKYAKQPTGRCPHCKHAFNFYSDNIKKFSCPSCRKKIVRNMVYQKKIRSRMWPYYDH